jgi:hypothetical protein
VPVAMVAERGDASADAGARLVVPLLGGSPVLGFDGLAMDADAIAPGAGFGPH